MSEQAHDKLIAQFCNGTTQVPTWTGRSRLNLMLHFYNLPHVL